MINRQIDELSAVPPAGIYQSGKLDQELNQSPQLLSDLEDVDKAARPPTDQDSWTIVVQQHTPLVVGGVLVLSWVISFLNTGNLVARVNELNEMATHLSVAIKPTTPRIFSDEVTQLEALLDTLKMRLLDAINREQFSSFWAADAELKKTVTRKQINEMRAAAHNSTRIMMDQMPAGLLVLSDSGCIRFVNATGEKYLNEPADRLLGKPFVDLLIGTNIASPTTFIELMQQRPWYHIATVAAKDSQPIRVQMCLREFVRLPDETLYLLVLLDCTEDQKFKELQQRLIAMIAHDIATPLSTVDGVLELSGTGFLGRLRPSMQDDLTKAREEWQRILATFNNIVRLEKLISSSTSLEGLRLSLFELTKEAVQVSRDTIVQKDLAVTSTVDERIAAAGSADDIAKLGAKLLQLVVSSCNSEASIMISASEDQQSATWKLTIDDDAQILQRIKPYLENADVLDVNADISNLDAIMWRLLLQQSGARLSYTSGPELPAIALCFPSAGTP